MKFQKISKCFEKENFNNECLEAHTIGINYPLLKRTLTQ